MAVSATLSKSNKKEAPAATPSDEPGFFQELGGMASFGFKFLKQFLLPPYEFGEFLRQCYFIGYASLGLVSITGFIMGVVLTLQSYPTLKGFGAESMLPNMVSISIVREIGPIITALICAGRIGSSIGAELGSMKVTEQIDAMEVSGTNPFHFIVITRVLACITMIPLLVLWTDFVGLIGGWVGVNINANMKMFLYFNQCYGALEFGDIIPATIKTFFFGYAIGIIGCYKGYNTSSGTEGVGKAANSAVVAACLSVFVLDALAVQITNLIDTLKF